MSIRVRFTLYTGFMRRVHESRRVLIHATIFQTLPNSDVGILTTFILIIPDCDNESNFYEEIQAAINQTETDRDLFNEPYLMIGAKPSYKVRNSAYFLSTDNPTGIFR